MTWRHLDYRKMRRPPPGQDLHSETRIDETLIDSLAAFGIVFEIEETQGIELDEITLSKNADYWRPGRRGNHPDF